MKVLGSGESAGAVPIFNWSTVYNKLRCKAYIGDGDTHSYHEVVKGDPCKGFNVKKGECIGHVKKQLGTRLQNMWKKLRGTKLSDGKPLIGKGRQTEKIIKLLQNHYGMALRQNTKTRNNKEITKVIIAVLYHCSDK